MALRSSSPSRKGLAGVLVLCLLFSCRVRANDGLDDDLDPQHEDEDYDEDSEEEGEDREDRGEDFPLPGDQIDWNKDIEDQAQYLQSPEWIEKVNRTRLEACAEPSSHICPEDIVTKYRDEQEPDGQCTLYPPHAACSPGYFTTDIAAKWAPLACCPGFYCPVGLTCLIPCSRGAYCPYPRPYDADVKNYIQYNETIYGKPGMAEDEPCPGGFYCPSPTEKEKCPSGYFCRRGEDVKTPCPWLTVCREQTIVPVVSALGVLVNFLVVCVVVAGHSCIERAHRRMVEMREFQNSRPSPTRGLLGTLLGVLNVFCIGSAIYFILERVDKAKGRIGFSAVGENDDGSEVGDFEMQEVDVDTNTDQVEVAPASCDRDLLNLFIKNKRKRMLAEGLLLDIRFENLSLVLRSSGRTVLSEVSGYLRPGRVTAVMGPSGAGKTTFINALAGKTASYGNLSGSIYVNGEEVDTLSNLRDFVGFVPQEDIMHTMLTPQEILQNHAAMFGPCNMSMDERFRMVDDVLNLLGIFDVRHTKVGDQEERGLSGGQRKRVNIGMELVKDPIMLILDEPTSGLDASSARGVMHVLRCIAELGITVLAVIHQPRFEVFRTFDDLLLLGEGGRTVYMGPQKEAVSYFTQAGYEMDIGTNPADFLMDVVSGNSQRRNTTVTTEETSEHPSFYDMWVRRRSSVAIPMISPSLRAASGRRRMSTIEDVQLNDNLAGNGTASRTSADEGSEAARDSVNNSLSPVESGIPESRGKQTSVATLLPHFRVCFHRALLQQRRSMSDVLTDVFLIIFGGAVLGVMNMNMQLKDVLSSALHSSIIIFMTSNVSSLRVFGPERVVFWRESASGLNRFSYFAAKNLAAIPMLLVIPILFLTTFSQFAMPRGSLVALYSILACVSVAGSGFGYFLSLLVDSAKAQVSCVVFALSMAMMSGQRPTLEELSKSGIHGKLIPYISFARYSVEAFVLTELGAYTPLWRYKVQAMLDHQWYHKGNTPFCLVMLIIIGLVCRGCALTALFVVNRDKQK